MNVVVNLNYTNYSGSFTKYFSWLKLKEGWTQMFMAYKRFLLKTYCEKGLRYIKAEIIMRSIDRYK